MLAAVHCRGNGWAVIVRPGGCNLLLRKGVLVKGSMTGDCTDTELIAKALEGERNAFEMLVRRYQAYVFTLAMRFVRNREDAEEVAQDSFLKAFRNLAGFRERSRFSTWLYTIVYTTAMTHLRKRRPELLPLDAGQPEAGPTVRPAEGAERLLERKIGREYIRKAIDKLLPDDASILTLFYLGEQSLEEIGQVTGIATATVKVKLHRARQRFRVQLEHILKHEARELL